MFYQQPEIQSSVGSLLYSHNMKTTIGPHGHGRYYIVNENIQLPSVTTILGEMTDKSGIEKWKKRVGEATADKISKNAADRGTFMHELNERYQYLLVNEKDDNSILKKTFDDVLAKPEMSEISNENKENGKNLFVKLLNDGQFNRVEELVLQEEAVWSGRGGGYAGRLDKAAKVEDGKLKRFKIGRDEESGVVPFNTVCKIRVNSNIQADDQK